MMEEESSQKQRILHKGWRETVFVPIRILSVFSDQWWGVKLLDHSEQLGDKHR